MLRSGFQSFVAWRYLMARPRRWSPALVALILGVLVASGVAFTVGRVLLAIWEHNHKPQPFNEFLGQLSPIHAYDRHGLWAMRGIGAGLAAIGGALAAVGGLQRRRLSLLPGMAARVAPGPVSWRRAIGWGLALAGTKCVGFAFTAEGMLAKHTFVEVATWWSGVALAPLVLLVPLLVLRYFFTFFTTVSMAGVFIGSMALVVVLSVMSGFETDLRDKILGSNAHVRVTRDEGMIADWREVMARVRAVPGVVAVTPYATSEVVLSANSNYASVIIKGIDPETVGDVTRLVASLKDSMDRPDPQAMDRIYPLRRDDLDHPEPPEPDPDGDHDVVDPAPDDLPAAGDPIDFSGRDDGPAPDPDPADPRDLDADAFGPVEPGDAAPPADPDGAAGPVDPVPDDFAGGGDDGPADFSGRAPGRPSLEEIFEVRATPRGATRSRELPPSSSGRLALLDGVLVGKELVKQLHLFTGKEVRLVSPLADPANPDATGTPIPFHRDYRIAGQFYTGMYEYDLKFVYVPLESLQQFLQLGDEVDGIEVRITDPELTGAVARRIRAALGPEFVVQDWKELNRNLFSALKLEKIAMFLVLAIIILVASFSIVGNLIMVVVEKGKEIALLKTLGAGDRGVMQVFVMQGVFIGVVGTLTGVALGLAICVYCQLFGFPINPDVYYIDTLPVHIDAWSVAMIGAAGVVISGVATLYPAFVAARLRPAVGLRHD